MILVGVTLKLPRVAPGQNAKQMFWPGRIDCFGRKEGNIISDFLLHTHMK